MHKLKNLKNTPVITFFLFRVLILIILFMSNSLIRAQESAWASPLQKCWEYKSNQMTNLDLASDNDSIYLTSLNGELSSIDIYNGIINWKVELGGQFTTKARHFDNKLFVNTKFTNKEESTTYITRQINNKTGITTWLQIDDQKQVQDIFTDNENLYLVSEDGFINKFEKERKFVWSKNIDVNITTDIFKMSNNILIFGTLNKTILFLSELNGDIEAQVNLKGVPSSIILNKLENIFVGDIEGNLYSYNRNNSNQTDLTWRTKLGGKVSEIEILGDDLLVSSDDNFVYLISTKDGRKIWKRKLAGRIIGKKVLDKNNVAFLTFSSNTVVVLDLVSGKISNKIVLDELVYFVSKPILVDNTLVIPTQKGLFAYSFKCK